MKWLWIVIGNGMMKKQYSKEYAKEFFLQGKTMYNVLYKQFYKIEQNNEYLLVSEGNGFWRNSIHKADLVSLLLSWYSTEGLWEISDEKE